MANATKSPMSSEFFFSRNAGHTLAFGTPQTTSEAKTPAAMPIKKYWQPIPDATSSFDHGAEPFTRSVVNNASLQECRSIAPVKLGVAAFAGDVINRTINEQTSSRFIVPPKNQRFMTASLPEYPRTVQHQASTRFRSLPPVQFP